MTNNENTDQHITGIISYFDVRRRLGTIRYEQDGIENKIFFSFQRDRKYGAKGILLGDEVSFEFGEDHKGRTCACNLRFLGNKRKERIESKIMSKCGIMDGIIHFFNDRYYFTENYTKITFKATNPTCCTVHPLAGTAVQAAFCDDSHRTVKILGLPVDDILEAMSENHLPYSATVKDIADAKVIVELDTFPLLGRFSIHGNVHYHVGQNLMVFVTGRRTKHYVTCRPIASNEYADNSIFFRMKK